MAPPNPGLTHLSNALATPEQLSASSSLIDGVPSDLEASIRCAGTQLTQAAGVLLHLSQDIIAQAIVIFTRFWLGADGGSLRIYSVKDVSAAALYLTAKLSFQPTSPRSVLNVYTLLLSQEASPLWFVNPRGAPKQPPSADSYTLTEGGYQSARLILLRIESVILRTLSFDTHVALPHTIALTYLQTLGVTDSAVSRRTPNALAVAAIYLASREQDCKLVDGEWWEVFDVDREELGFLVVGMKSTEGFMRAETEKWKGPGKPIPLVVEEVDAEIERSQMMQEGE
ncbi:hypothetical protein N7481_005612 [Penicillium waksmanii]|uniref:uncharacterized protein n=1 Tax=Penicillium waksmanii TaxID=69791 RepID=UPI002546B329|nr:uncharacterized protein N7481_005612 [Penicillium waksmanii]KAJ5983513.1 hypothetical protein N7481_005612 [Penicillium waksmanii]